MRAPGESVQILIGFKRIASMANIPQYHDVRRRPPRWFASWISPDLGQATRMTAGLLASGSSNQLSLPDFQSVAKLERILLAYSCGYSRGHAMSMPRSLLTHFGAVIGRILAVEWFKVKRGFGA